jgi:hypothetical protein
MRRPRATLRVVLSFTLLSVALLLAACGSDGDGGGGGDDDAPPAAQAFEIVTPDIVLQPGEERTFCYYTTIQSAADLGVARWESHMTPGSHHLILYFTPTAKHPDGTLTEDCDGGALPIWTYSSQSPDDELTMPDGVGMTVAAGQKAFVQMHYLNTGDAPLTANVSIKGHAYAAGTDYIPAAPFITFHTMINVPPNDTASVEGRCDVPADAKFFVLSTHAHRFSTRTEVRDGDDMVFQSDDWEHPGGRSWDAPFYSFKNELVYRCEYENFTSQPVTTGDSAETDEMCMAVGFFFPATAPIYCVDSTTF